VLAGRRRAALDDTLAACEDAPDGCFAKPTDVTDPGQVDALFGAVRERLGRVDVLVNSAGTFGPSAPIERYPIDGFATVIATNLTGAFLCARRAFADMVVQRPSGGRIVNVGSLSAHVPRPHAVAYTAAKHAISGLTKAMALEGRAHAIACGQIDVGNAATEMTERLTAGALQPDGSVAPEPTIDPGHVADAVLYMVGLPLSANVPSIAVMATTMPYVGRG
jgi:NAD(P)-dependent dehydrogenase (short-subunit alcohol dehydrogenase family)